MIEIPCPNCEKQLKVPEEVFGKKIKCKHCGEPFRVEDPDASRADDEDEDEKPKKKGKGEKPAAVAPSKPGAGAIKAKKEKEDPKKPAKQDAKKEEPKKEEAKPGGTYGLSDDDEEDSATPKALGVVDEGVEIPRCPHCAAELDPPDAVVCISCGFNTITRVKAQSKKVWEPDANDWINHLAPGIAAAILCIIIVVTDIVCWVSMKDWMSGTFLEKDEPSATGDKAFYVSPGAFIALIIALDIMPLIIMANFAVKRLAIDNKPREREKK
jgi:hypothetical protein